MSKVIVNARRDHIWDGNVVVTDIPGVGRLEVWKTGIVGGRNECHYARLRSPARLASESLAELARSNDIRSGSPFGEDEPREEEPAGGGDPWTYRWTYHPSTD